MRDLRPGVFDRVRIITATAAVGRLASQALAERLGILSGVDFVTPETWLEELQLRLGEGERSPWRGRRLQLAVWEALKKKHQIILVNTWEIDVFLFVLNYRKLLFLLCLIIFFILAGLMIS